MDFFMQGEVSRASALSLEREYFIAIYKLLNNCIFSSKILYKR